MLNLTLTVINVFSARDIWVLERKNRVSIDSRMK